MINDLKSKIPALNKNKQIEDVEDENAQDSSEVTNADISAGDKTSSTDISDLDEINESTESLDLEQGQEQAPKSLVDKIKALFNKSKTSSGEKKPDKKKVIVIGAILILAILFLFEDESTQNGGEVATEASAQKAMEEKIAKRKREREAAKKKNIETATVEGTTEKVDEKIETTNTTENTSQPVTEENEASKNLSEESLGIESPSQSDSSASENANPQTTEIESAKPVEENKVEEAPITESNTEIISSDGTGQDIVDDTSSTDQNGDLTEKILEDLEKKVKSETPKEQKKEYVSPPDYEYLGRGLVYNCSGKHWACVDGPSYKVCEDNYSSVQYLKKPIECYPFNVYETQRGCESMQNRVVSSNAKTTFCNGN